MDKKRMAKMMIIAEKALIESSIYDKETGNITDSYNGLTAGFGVTVAMNGLLPAIVMYYQDSNASRKTDRRQILDIIGKMISLDGYKPQGLVQINDATSLLWAAIADKDGKTLKREVITLKREVIDCAVALKQIIRTHNLVKNEESK